MTLFLSIYDMKSCHICNRKCIMTYFLIYEIDSLIPPTSKMIYGHSRMMILGFVSFSNWRKLVHDQGNPAHNFGKNYVRAEITSPQPYLQPEASLSPAWCQPGPGTKYRHNSMVLFDNYLILGDPERCHNLLD